MSFEPLTGRWRLLPLAGTYPHGMSSKVSSPGPRRKRKTTQRGDELIKNVAKNRRDPKKAAYRLRKKIYQTKEECAAAANSSADALDASLEDEEHSEPCTHSLHAIQ